MSAITLGTNIASVRAQRHFSLATSATSTSFERLSSGMRVLSAADDAAGLAIASSLNLDSRIYTQAVRNLSDGISFLNVAEGTLHSINSVAERQMELAEQGANGLYSSQQRAALDAESAALTKEINRIVESASYNGINLFRDAPRTVTFQGGYGAEGALSVSLGGHFARESSGSFSSAVSFSASSGGPYNVEVADLNGDSILDLITADGTAGTLGVFIGNGDGSFKGRVTYSVSGIPTAAIVRDFNGDGRADVAATGFSAGVVTVRLGVGDGTLGAAQTFAVGPNAVNISVGDINNDGVLDLAAVNQGTATPSVGNSVSVLVGLGDGTFAPQVSFSLSVGATPATPRAVLLSDVNGDGNDDVITGDNGTSLLSVFVSNGDGTFKARTTYRTGTTPRNLASSDLNGDGKIDLVSADVNSNNLSIYFGNGDGSFRERVTIAAGGPYTVAISDVDRDGYEDLLTADSGTNQNSMSVYYGYGDGTFSSRNSFGTIYRPFDLGIGDFNRDGITDVTSADFNGVSVSVLLGKGRSATAPTISLLTQQSSLNAFGEIKAMTDRISLELGTLGAMQGRLEFAMRNLETLRTKTKEAGSRITDLDVAAESAEQVQGQIRMQASASVLAQANQAPRLVLSLLS